MKKRIALFLATFLLLCSCAANEPKALLEQGEGKRTESIAVVKVTINPEFELYLDLNMCVSKVRCLNEDAATALASTESSVVGIPYYQAITLLLNSVDQAGFLAQGAEVNLETTIHTSMDEESLQNFDIAITSPVEYFGAEHNLDLIVAAPAPVMDKKVAEDFNEYYENQIALQPEPSNEASVFICDENGSEIGIATYIYNENGQPVTVTENYYDGNSIHESYEYDDDGTLTKTTYTRSDGWSGSYTYYANGNICLSISDSPDGEHTEFYYAEDGQAVSSTQILFDGTTFCESFEYDDNGTLIKTAYTRSDGWSGSYTYYANGNVRLAISDSPDGEHTEFYYAENGTLISGPSDESSVKAGSVVTTVIYNGDIEGIQTTYYNDNALLYKIEEVFSDGMTRVFHYYESGEQESVITDYASGHFEWYYDQSGVPTAYLETDAEGNRMETTFYSDGTEKTYSIQYVSGATKEVQFRENGQLKYSITNDENGQSESFYDENGTLTENYTTTANGTYYESFYYPNGNSSSSYIRYIDGKTVETVCYESGNLKSKIENEPGSYRELHYNEAGIVTYDLVISSTLRWETFYDEEGNILEEKLELYD